VILFFYEPTNSIKLSKYEKNMSDFINMKEERNVLHLVKKPRKYYATKKCIEKHITHNKLFI